MKTLLLIACVLLRSCEYAPAANAPQLPKPLARFTLGGPDRPHCTTNCPPAITSKLLVWDHYGPGPQFIRFDIEAKRRLTDTTFFVLATVTQTQYRVWFTNGDQLFIKIAAWDSALRQKAGGWQ